MLDFELNPYNVSRTATMAYQVNFCHICLGAKSVFNFQTQKVEYDAELAFSLAWERYTKHVGIGKPHKCACARVLENLNADLAKSTLKVISDDGWNLHYEGSSYKEYWRTMVFDREPNTRELDLYYQKLIYDHCPGWGGVFILNAKKLDGGQVQITFKTYWDFKD